MDDQYPASPFQPSVATTPYPHLIPPQPQLDSPFISRLPAVPMPPQQEQYTLLANQLVGTCVDAGTMKLSSILGVGAFGALFRGHVVNSVHPSLPSLSPDRTYAVKVIMITNPAAAIDNSRYANSEYRLHTKCSNHPNVVTLYRVLRERNLYFLIMDYYEDGDLFNMITDKQVFLGRTEFVRSAILQIIDGLHYSHSLGIYHRDIKPENILCRNTMTNQLPQIVIADFGLATDHGVCWDSGVGSMYYMAPEAQGDHQPKHRRGRFRVNPYSPAAHDVWSLGVLLINLACGRNPWKKANPEDNTFACYIQRPSKFLMEILPISHELNDILTQIFLPEAQRISLQHLREKIVRVKRFTLSGAELQSASGVLKQAAGPVLIARALAEDEYFDAFRRPPAFISDDGIVTSEEEFDGPSDAVEEDVDLFLDISWPKVPSDGVATLDQPRRHSDLDMPRFHEQPTVVHGGAGRGVGPAVTSHYDIAQHDRFYEELALKEPFDIIPTVKSPKAKVAPHIDTSVHKRHVVNLDTEDDDMTSYPSRSMSLTSSDRSPSQDSSGDCPPTPESGPSSSPANVHCASPSNSPISNLYHLPPSSTSPERGLLWKAARYSMERLRNHQRGGNKGLAIQAGPHYYSPAAAAAVAAAKQQKSSPQQKKRERNSFIKSLIPMS